MSEKTVVRIAINLEGKIKDEFLAVKEFTGIKNNTDVLRYLVKWYHNKEIKKESS